jgi:hypothetical protein
MGTWGHGVVGSSDTKIAEGPQNSARNVWKLQAPRESRQKLRQSYATDRELERLWNMARKTLMLSVQSTAILAADKIERNWQRSASIHDRAILPHLIGTPTKTPFEMPRFDHFAILSVGYHVPRLLELVLAVLNGG